MECPYIDGADERCAQTLSLQNVQQAVSLCAYDHLNCPVYRALRMQRLTAVEGPRALLLAS